MRNFHQRTRVFLRDVLEQGVLEEMRMRGISAKDIGVVKNDILESIITKDFSKEERVLDIKTRAILAAELCEVIKKIERDY